MNDWFIQNLIKSSKISLAPLEYLYEEGSAIDGIYLIKTGKIATFKQHQKNKILLNLYQENQVVGLGHLKSSIALHSALAIHQVELGFFPRSIIEDFVQQNFDFGLQMMQAFCKEINEVEQKRLALLRKNNKQYLAHLLLRLMKVESDSNYSPMLVTYSKEIIARLSDISLSNLQKIMMDFERKGWIELEKNQIKVLEPQQLSIYIGL